MTLHTSANCSMPTARTMAGTATGNDCDVDTSNNAGCGVQASTDYSFGPSFNAIGGGWYAMERNPDSISVWFWARNATGTVPSDMSSGNDSIDTDAWEASGATPRIPYNLCNNTNPIVPPRRPLSGALRGSFIKDTRRLTRIHNSIHNTLRKLRMPLNRKIWISFSDTSESEEGRGRWGG
ncbi:hypothetical protein PHLCEN_2v5639 [Hermanssonia centrifuga]|uniref:Uncharacterized protein n=1 Tax=Hermanssonia centrifuga TaxID=98765 RepID=A0A2R6P2D2_9APHY|nr:hypothetical protein PHLCEN_2v5639 [Hermanssonia centrifuga]